MDQVLKDIRGIKNAVQACNKDPDLIKKLESTQSKLEMCEKSLANYLEQKRRIFPPELHRLLEFTRVDEAELRERSAWR